MAYTKTKDGFTVKIGGAVVAFHRPKEEALASLHRYKNDVDYKFYLGKLPYKTAIEINREIFNTQNEIMQG